MAEIKSPEKEAKTTSAPSESKEVKRLLPPLEKKELPPWRKIISAPLQAKKESLLANLATNRQPTPPPSDPAKTAIDEGLTMGELAVRLDTYDDIFSDFDPRPHSRRELSEDLIKELSRRYRENPKGDLELRFFIPAPARDARLEGVIRKRLKDHFMIERQKIQSQINDHRTKGLRYMAVGFGMLLAELYISFAQPTELWVKVMSVLLTPAGWFSLWTGMEKLVEVPYNLENLRSFYEKFSKCNYVFVTRD